MQPNPGNFQAIKAQYASRVAGATETIHEPLYDSVTYAAAGQTSLQFFSTPLGQGTTAQGASGVKTLSDTNMTNAGLLSSGNAFLIETIELSFFPSGNINTFGIDPAAEVPTFADDVNEFYKQGALELFISSKPYLNQAPLAKFPPANRLFMDSSSTDTTTASTTQLSSAQYAAGCGPIFRLHPAPQLITQNMNFSVTLNWPAVVALPSAATAVVVCTLGGLRFRNVQ